MSTLSTISELTTEANAIVMGALKANNRRQIAYAKNVWDVLSVPYSGNDLKTNVAATIERAEKVIDLTMEDLETTSKSTIELAEKIVAVAAKAREESLEAARSLAITGVTTVKSALEKTEERLETISKRLDVTLEDAKQHVAEAH